MKMLSLDDAIKAVTMLLDCEDDTDKVWSCDVINNLRYAPSVTDVDPGIWISVKDRLPEQHKSIFAPWYGKKEWTTAMWLEESDRVIVTIQFVDNTRVVCTGKLCDRQWKTYVSPTLKPVVTHWMPLPEPPKEE